MNYWEEKPDFWRNRTLEHGAYINQKAELVEDIKEIIEKHNIKRVIDVGGYKGIVGEMLPDGVEYINLDIVNGVDITKPWAEQETLTKLRKRKDTLIFTSITLICIPPEQMHGLLAEIRKYGDHFYFYEEKFDPTKDHDGEQISHEYGGKWSYDWKRLLHWGTFWKEAESRFNPKWVRIWSIPR